MKAITFIFGLICGAVAGFGLGFLAAITLGYVSQLASPDDPSAGAVAIVVIITAPVGAIIGAIVGCQVITEYPRIFRVTILPLAILLVAFQVTYSTLRRMDRPRHFVVVVEGTPGAEYVGLVSVDGEKSKKKKGTLPAKFEFDGYRVEMAFALMQPDEKKNIQVKVSANGNDLRPAVKTETGIYKDLKSYGYSETFGGTAAVRWTRMSPEDVKALIENDKMPRDGGIR